MSRKPLPFDSHAVLAQSVRKLLADDGPLTSKEIVRRLRGLGSPLLQSSAVRKVLEQTMSEELERQKGNVFALVNGGCLHVKGTDQPSA